MMDDERQIFGYKRNIFFLGLVSFFNDFSAEMVQSVMPVFLTTVLGAPSGLIGIIEGSADALASVLKLFSGWFSDKIERRKLPAILGYSLSVGIRPLLALTTTLPQVFGLRMIDRVGKGFRDAPRDALITESVSKADLGRSFGFHRTMDTLGAVLGPLTAFLLLPYLHDNYRTLFLIAFFVGLGAIGSFAFVKEKPRDPSKPRKVLPALNMQLLRGNRRFALIVGAIFIFGIGTIPILLLLLRATEVGLPKDQVPLVYLLYNVSFIIFAIPLGKLADMIGERVVISGGFILATIVYFGLAWSNDLTTVLLLFALLGVYSAATDGVQRSLASKWVAPEILATGQGFLNTAIGLSSLIAGVVGGFLWTLEGSMAALTYAGVLSSIGCLFFLFLSRTAPRR